MAYLKINGHTIRPRIGSQRRNDRMGDIGRSYQGKAHFDERANKSKWRFMSVPLTEIEAEYLRGIFKHEGHSWPFDSDNYSYFGLGPDSNAQSTLRSTTAADGDPVVHEAKFGAASVAVDDATTNILPADSRDAENAPTGYSSIVGGTISGDTSNYWQGTKSVKVVTATGNNGVGTNYSSTGGALNDVIYGTVYLKADSSALTLNVYIYDGTNAVKGADFQYTVQPNQWQRFSCYHTLTAASTQLSMVVYCPNVGTFTWYADGWQIEVNKMTSWIDGARASADQLIFDHISWLQSQNLGVSFWTTGPVASTEAEQTLWQFGVDSNNFIEIVADYSADTLILRTRNGGVDADITKTSAWDGDFHHIAIAIRYNPEAGEYNRQLWYDGSSVGTDNTGTLPDNSTFTTISIGCNILAANQSNAQIDDMIIVPYPLFADVVSAWYTYGESLAILPYYYAEGDFADGRQTVMGVYNGEENFVYVANGVDRINGVLLDYELWGV